MKKPIVWSWTSAVAALLLFGDARPAQATHFRYGTLNWSPTGLQGQVEIRLRAAFRRDSNWGPVNTGAIITETQGNTRLVFGDGSITPTLRFLITAHSVTENWVIGEALNPGTNNIGVRKTYSGAGPYTAFLGDLGGGGACCRIGQGGLPPLLNNRAGAPYPLQTIIRPLDGNSSPVSSIVPVVVVPAGAATTFLVPGADPDFDTLSWRMSTVAEAGGGPHPPGIGINPANGVVTWNNVGLNQANFWTTQVVLEDLTAPGGTAKSKSPVDFLLRIQPQIGSLPTCALSPAGPFTVLSGTNLTFTVTGTDADPGDVTLHSGGMPGGVTLTPPLPLTGPNTGVTTTFSWTPTAAQEGAHVILFTATDPPGQQGMCSTTVQVINNALPSIDCPDPLVVEGCTAPGGSEITRTVHVEDANGDALTVTFRVDGAVVQTVQVPSGGITTKADVPFTHFYTLGPHVLHVTVSDGLAQDTCQTTVTVTDTTPPVVTCTTVDTTLWPPNHTMRTVGLAAAAQDNCSGASNQLAVAVFGDEDDEMPTGDGNFSPDAKDIASGTLRLRSERRGDADGRVYLIHVTGTDPAGNNAVNCCTVTVTHSQSPRAKASVAAQAAAALATCQQTGAPPANYFIVGDGPIIGSKQ